MTKPLNIFVDFSEIYAYKTCCLIEEVEACDCWQRKSPQKTLAVFSWYITQFFPSLEMHSITPSLSAARFLLFFPPFIYCSLIPTIVSFSFISPPVYLRLPLPLSRCLAYPLYLYLNLGICIFLDSPCPIHS